MKEGDLVGLVMGIEVSSWLAASLSLRALRQGCPLRREELGAGEACRAFVQAETGSSHFEGSEREYMKGG